MTTFRSQTARILLDRIAEHERGPLVQSIATSLNENSEAADLELVAALLHLQPDRDAEQNILDFLGHLVQRGRHEHLVLVSERNPTLASELVQRTVFFLDAVADKLQAEPRKWITVAPNCAGTPEPPKTQVYAAVEEAGPTSVIEGAIHSLDFISRAVLASVDIPLHHSLFQHCMLFIGAADRALAKAAQRSLFSLLSSQALLEKQDISSLWSRIQDLVAADDAFYKTVGFSLWLRWLLSEQAIVLNFLQQPAYWNLLVDGLRKGDSERRKAALQVLRASIDAAAGTPSVLASIAAVGPRSIDSADALQRQCGRFCTVFETIVLGRYLNQVQECEADLDFLASSQSLLKPVWLYTLLTSALDKNMQESNRKFIGTWILRSKPKMDDVEVALSFFRNAFLPWATGGSLFTSTLRLKDGIMRSQHGDDIAAYVRDLILDHPDIADRIINAILDAILARYSNNFAYSMVYLIDGIGQAFESATSPAVKTSQVEKLRRIAGWTGFPEVARDYILARSWKISHDQERRSGSEKQSSLWCTLQDKIVHLGSGSSAHVDGNVASLALAPSKREQYERKAIEKCLNLVAELSSEGAFDIEGCRSAIDDIWSDLDYLEYPKSLLVNLPSLIPHRRLVQAAEEDSEAGRKLAELLAARIDDLFELSESRSYLLSPLMRAVREAVFQQHHAALLMQLEDIVIKVSDHPAAPTVDTRLEDATVPLLQSLGSGMEKLNYEYYFGPRERHGFASLLDVVSRLSDVNATMNKSLFYRLLTRWREQKTPPPSVSSWKTTLQLQIMLLCCEQHISKADVYTASSVVKDLHYILAIEPLPRYRYLLEWIIARVYIHHPNLQSGLFDELRTKDHHSNPKFLASLMKLGVMLAKTDSSDETFALELATVFVPLAASSKVIIRHEAQWQIPVLMNHATAKGWASISQNTTFQALDDFIRSLERFGDPPLERQIDKLDPINDHNLTHLVSGPWYELDTVEQRQTSHDDFVTLYALDKTSTYPIPRSCMPLGNPLPTTNRPPTKSSSTQINHTRTLLQNIDNISRALGSGPVAPTALQTKGAAYLESARCRHDHLLVVASLIDNPYNLGGLSRVSEIFGAGALYLPNPNVAGNKDFANVSVSSHLHFPLEALAAGDVPAWLSRMKREDGYTVVGIEQTDRSVLLGRDECLLPEKCIVVLGSEREGIPAMVLGECDVLVEIPQVGVTRSLNVQTAAGIVLCEYVRQHKK